MKDKYMTQDGIMLLLYCHKWKKKQKGNAESVKIYDLTEKIDMFLR